MKPLPATVSGPFPLTSPLLARLFSLLIAVACCQPWQAVAADAAPTGTVTRYTVTSRGLRIGTATSTQERSSSNGVAITRFETVTKVNASFLWLGYHLDTVERGVIRDGALVEYQRRGEEDGTAIAVEGRLEGSVFRFHHLENGVRKTAVIPRAGYDATTMECPEALLEFRGQEQVTLRVLDVEHQQVVTRHYRLVSEGSCTVDGTDYPCRTIDFTDQHKSVRRWIGRRGNAVITYRQDGQGKQGRYSVRAATIRHTP